MIKKNIIKPSILILASLLILMLLLGGCTTTAAPQGWSGCVAGPANIYYGSLSGKLISINPESRLAKRPFPITEKGEFSVDLAVNTGGGGLCGPMFSCTSAARNDVVYCTPAVSDNLVYVATYSGTLYAFNSQSRLTTNRDARWTYPKVLGAGGIGSIIGNMVLADKNIYLASANGYVYGFTQEFGDSLWDPFNAGDKIWTTPAYANGTLFAGTFGGNLFSLSAKSGKENWKVKLPSAEASAPVVYKDKVVLGTFDRNLYALSQADGSIKWTFAGGNWFWADPVTKDNLVFAPCLDGNIYAINGDTGQQAWKTEVGNVSAKPALSGNTLAAINQTGDLYLIDATTGSIIQKVSVHATLAPLFIDKNVIYVHSLDDSIYAVDSSTGTMLWSFKPEK